MIDPFNEEVISLVGAVELFPKRRKGRKPSVSCLYRWTTIGCRGIVLESVQVGGTRCTSKEAIRHFLERLTAQKGLGGPQPTRRAKRDLADAEHFLDEQGIGAAEQPA